MLRTAGRGPRLLLAGVLLLFLVAHLARLAPSLEDIDSVNFALGVRDFDVAKHQPHPPGYPVFIALSKVSTAAARALGADAAGGQAEARGLSFWGAVAGALLVLPLFVFFRAVDDDPLRAALACVVTVANPLMWINASRPLSDVPGLAVSTVAQALLASAFVIQKRGDAGLVTPDADRAALLRSGRLIVLGALVAGLAIGMRSQSAWLTFPLLAVVLIDRIGRDVAGALLGGTVTFVVGVLLWLVPLLIVSGGPSAYIAAFSAQAGEDIQGVDMLATNPTPRRLAFALLHTFVYPWASTPLAVVVIAAAAVGLAVVAWKTPRALLPLAAVAVPYGLFHLVLQETFTTRYALPLVPFVAWLAVRGFGALGRTVQVAGAAGVIAASLALGVPSTLAYAAHPSPLFRTAGELQQALDRAPAAGRPVVAMHHAVARALRGEALAARALPSPAGREWTPVVDYWLKGGTAPVWFLAEPRRTDLAMFDPAAQRVRSAAVWPLDDTTLLGGVRPAGVEWVEITQPGWFVTDGWALTPEMAGLAERERRGPSRGGVTAWIRRRGGEVTLLVGGRNLGAAGEPDVRFTLALDDRTLADWTVAPAPGFFLDQRVLPAGALEGAGAFAKLSVTAEAADGSARPVRAAVEQFDLQPPSGVIRAFGRGWHEMEYAPSTGRRWRWSSDVSILRVTAPPGRDVALLISGESPLRYFSTAPTVQVLVGSTVLSEFAPAADFAQRVVVPAAALAAAGGEVTLKTSEVFVPDDRTGNGDHRRLGLRIYDVAIADRDGLR